MKEKFIAERERKKKGQTRLKMPNLLLLKPSLELHSRAFEDSFSNESSPARNHIAADQSLIGLDLKEEHSLEGARTPLLKIQEQP